MVSLLTFQTGSEDSTVATMMIATEFPLLSGIVTVKLLSC